MKNALALCIVITAFSGCAVPDSGPSAPQARKVFNLPEDVALTAGVKQYITTGKLNCQKELATTEDGLQSWGCNYRGQWVSVYPKADGMDCGRIETELPHFMARCLVRFTRHIGTSTKDGWLELKSDKDGNWTFTGLYP
jgi:hypothetical protein